MLLTDFQRSEELTEGDEEEKHVEEKLEFVKEDDRHKRHRSVLLVVYLV